MAVLKQKFSTRNSLLLNWKTVYSKLYNPIVYLFGISGDSRMGINNYGNNMAFVRCNVASETYRKIFRNIKKVVSGGFFTATLSHSGKIHVWGRLGRYYEDGSLKATHEGPDVDIFANRETVYVLLQSGNIIDLASGNSIIPDQSKSALLAHSGWAPVGFVEKSMPKSLKLKFRINHDEPRYTFDNDIGHLALTSTFAIVVTKDGTTYSAKIDKYEVPKKLLNIPTTINEISAFHERCVLIARNPNTQFITDIFMLNRDCQVVKCLPDPPVPLLTYSVCDWHDAFITKDGSLFTNLPDLREEFAHQRETRRARFVANDENEPEMSFIRDDVSNREEIIADKTFELQGFYRIPFPENVIPFYLNMGGWNGSVLAIDINNIFDQ